MKKKRGFLYPLFPVVVTIGIYANFYTRIQTKPGNFGFWIIIAIGMSSGVLLASIIRHFKETGEAEL